jgi:phosphoribosylformylglycinamidine synthase II
VIDQDTITSHGLTVDEYDRIVSILGRDPNLLELGIFSVMWSEHCSYKSSRVHLKTLPTDGPRVLQGPGENAGVLDIGDGLAAVFKIESHNHPSFIEPYQGAATGVGGIIRDIFTMGARPIALLNSLRFGELDTPLTQRLVEGVVAGIAGYGNSIGIPTVGGEVAFDKSYAGNPLVNVFCLGIAPVDGIIKGRAEGVGNAVYYVGAKTGRDGIHGATMASAEFDDASEEKRPNVQVGDPFMEKLLLEACLEVMESDALIGLQDMGAAGLTCSSCEMGARGDAGIDIDVSTVPQRETNMTPYEIMLSESQERMLFIVRQGREAEVERVFEKWDLHAVRIGQVTGDGLLRVRDGGDVVAEIPNKPLADEAPLYERPYHEPSDFKARQNLDVAALDLSLSPTDVLLRLLSSPDIASKRWIYRQYDHMVRTNTIAPAGTGAGVVRLKGTSRALAFSVDGNGRYCYLDPYQGAMLAVAESARNVACAGGVPIGATNCLNFGNPERPEIMWQFARAVAGIGEACRALDIPITGGNVSLYNETDGEAILPTPVIGVVGLLKNSDQTVGRRFQESDSVVMLLGGSRASLGGSEYLKVVHGLICGVPPVLDLKTECTLQRVLVELVGAGLLLSAHDCSDGGLAVTLAECSADTNEIGCEVAIPTMAGGTINSLFGESASNVVVSIRKKDVSRVIELVNAASLPWLTLGHSGGKRVRISIGDEDVVDAPLDEVAQAWSTGVSRYFEDSAA